MMRAAWLGGAHKYGQEAAAMPQRTNRRMAGRLLALGNLFMFAASNQPDVFFPHYTQTGYAPGVATWTAIQFRSLA